MNHKIAVLLLTLLLSNNCFSQNNFLSNDNTSKSKPLGACNNWLGLPSQPSFMTVGDLDVPGDQITVEAVINRTTPYVGGFLYAGDIVSKHQDPINSNYLLRPSDAEITTADGVYHITPPVCDIELNKTYHVAMVYDGKLLKFYRNGFLLSQVAVSGNLFQNDFQTRIGFYQAQLYNENFIGYINEVRIWNVARTQAQIQAYMNSPLPSPASQTGLLAYYSFNSLTNLQGNPTWNGTLGGSAAISQTNPTCTAFVADNQCCPVNGGTLTGGSTCAGTFGNLTFHSTSVNAIGPYKLTYSDGTNVFTADNITDGISFPTSVVVSQNTNYSLLSIQDASGCAATSVSGISAFITATTCGTPNTSFTAPDEICLNKPVSIVNTSANVSSYFWTFCSTNFSQPPDAVNIGNPGNLLSGPVFTEVTKDNNGNYFVFATNNYNAHVVRMSFGNSLLNTPVTDDLGNFGGVIPPHTEGIQIINTNGRWYAIVQGGDPSVGDASSIAKIDFGTSLSSTNPVATNWGNIGNMAYPHKLYLFQENNRWYGYATNSNSNTLTLLDFGTDFSAIPTGVNLGNLGNLNLPVGVTAINHLGNWYLFILNNLDATITRLSFGNSLLNTPVAENIGNPQGNLVTPRDISFIELCNDIKALVVNANPNSLTQLDFGNNLTSVPTSTNLGNLGNLNFPHSISKLFRVNNDIYAFIPNVNDGTLTRLRFAGCDLPGSTLKDPAPIVYNRTGTYYINLLTDVGLPTQASFCKEIIVKDCCSPIAGDLMGNSICRGDLGMLQFHPTSTVLAPPFILVYSDSLNSYSQNNVFDNKPFSLPVNPQTTTRYTLLKIIDSNNCSTNITGETAMITVNIPATLTISSDTTICANTSLQLNVSGGINYVWSPATLLNNPGIPNPIAQPIQSTKYIVVGKDVNQCNVTASVQVNMEPAPLFKKPSDFSTCSGIPVLLNGNNDPNLLYSWTPIDNLDNAAAASPLAILDQTTDFNLVITDAFCPQFTSSYGVHVTVNQTPVVRASRSNDIDCSNLISTLSANGAYSYEWQPSSNLTNPDISSPIAKLSATTQFTVKGTSENGCSSFDSVTVIVTKTGQNAFSVPNAFTPNGDNLNDCFGIRNWGSVTLQQFTIYNRWGQKVFETNDPNACWDGTFQGVMQPAGSFVYLIRATSFCGDVVKKGSLLLIR